MFSKTVKYEDYNGNQRSETLWFNLTQTELLKIAMDLPDGTIPEDPNKVDNDQLAATLFQKLGNKGIYEFIESLVLKAYGVKSEDGRRFIKTPDMVTEFSQTLAFDAIMLELMSDANAAAAFINSAIPANVVGKMADSLPGPQVVPNN